MGGGVELRAEFVAIVVKKYVFNFQYFAIWVIALTRMTTSVCGGLFYVIV